MDLPKNKLLEKVTKNWFLSFFSADSLIFKHIKIYKETFRTAVGYLY